MKKTFLLTSLATASILALTPMAFAADEYNVSNGLTLSGSPLGMHGIDPVGYQWDNRAVDGTAKFAAAYDGVEYYFSSEDTKAAFVADPHEYLPQNGGFCTLGVSLGKKLDGNPKFADIVDGKLYLFVNAAVFENYKKDKAGTIARAAEVWKEVRSTPIEKL